MLMRLPGRYLRPYWLLLAAVIVFQLAQSIASLYLPSLNADIIDDGVAKGDTGTIVSIGGVMLGITLVQIACAIAAVYFGARAAMAFGRDVRRAVFRRVADFSEQEAKIHRLPLSYFDRTQRGELLSRVTNDIVISPVLALIALVTIPLTLIITTLIAKRSQKLFVAQWRQTGELNAQVEEAYTGHALVRVFGRRPEVEERFDDKNEQLYDNSFGAQFVSGIIMPAMMFVGNLVYVAIAVVGGLMIAGGSISLGDVQAFIQYSRQFTQPLSQLGSMANLLQSGVASAERVFELLDSDEQRPDPARPERPAAASGRLVFEGVSFRYEAEKPLIEHLSLIAEPGQSIAIVGPTGAGKTTLVNLIMRFYELDSGRITLDGVDITRMTRDELRSRMGMVLQDTWLFAGTIRENITYGRPGATEEEILAAAKATYVDRFVRSLPDGYDTELDDEAANLSAGERQLVTIARAFLADPSVLILDEATSSVDTRTELLLQHAMNALREDRTSFVIAHRLSTIRDADLILVMESGRIVEQGTHDGLLAAGGAYARLYEAQFAAPLDDQPVQVGATVGVPSGAPADQGVGVAVGAMPDSRNDT